MTPEQLAQIEARVAAATPGPWIKQITDDGYLRVTDNPDAVNGICGFGDMEETDASDHRNAGFIAHARADIEMLKEEVKRLQAIEQATRRYLACRPSGPEVVLAFYELCEVCGVEPGKALGV